MKKLIYTSLALTLLIFTSCKKCQTCTTSVTQDVLGFENTTSTSEEYCGDDYDNAPAETSVTQDVGGGVVQTVTIDCVDS